MTNILNPFIIVDGSLYLYKAYHSYPFLTNSLGEPTGAIYGVLNMLRGLILKYHPTHAVVVFDMKNETFRNKLFESYKSNRQPMPNNLRIQIEPLQIMIKAMGLPLILSSGVEADDVIGTLARRMEHMGRLVLISTNDKDMAQLVTPKVILINNISNTLLGPTEVISKYGVPSELIVDLLALMGDSSDNIPGVPGIGKKTAQVLLREIGNLKTLYIESNRIANLNIRGAKTIIKKLEQNKDVAYLSYQLAKIRTDTEINLAYQQLEVHQPDIEYLLRLFRKYEFKHWILDVNNGRWLKSR